jgi:hypothetical protein
MNSWARVLAILKWFLLPVVQKPAEVERWIDGLDLSPDSKRLAISLAIDLAVGAYDDNTKNLLGQVLDAVDYSVAERSIEFGRRLLKHPRRKELYCASLFSMSKAAEDYVSVIHLVKFIAYAGFAFGYVDSSEDKALIRRRYKRGYQPRPLRGYGIWWTGEEQIVWITSARRFNEKWQPSDEELASQVKDALGLPTPGYVKDGVPLEYVAVHYPPGFTPPAHQPTALDAWWADSGQWYLSTGKLDAWGRTQSISGTLESQLERVHRAFQLERVGPDYKLWYLGTASVNQGNLDRVIQVGLDLVDKIEFPPKPPTNAG